ncbi:MAG: hypothetical protein J5493_01125 [Lachnospiraceae bacterium]|nr:hypothetical protein [Lachnospiraceae bacterium]
MQVFYMAAAVFLLGRIAREDAEALRIPAEENWGLAACSLVRVIAEPAEWAASLAAAVVFCGLLAAADLATARTRHAEGRLAAGGGDVKLVFALLLQVEYRMVPLWGGIACVYILATFAVWPDKRKLPLGPALAGAGVCVMLLRLTGGGF